jgi:hypothetical protein
VSEGRLLELGCLLIPAFQPPMTEYCTKPSDIDEIPELRTEYNTERAETDTFHRPEVEKVVPQQTSQLC